MNESAILFKDLCATFQLIEATTKRLEITDILTKFLVQVIKKSNQSDLLSVIYLCINRLGPTWEGRELGIGESLLMKAIGQSTGRPVAKIKSDMQQLGDLGLVA